MHASKSALIFNRRDKIFDIVLSCVFSCTYMPMYVIHFHFDFFVLTVPCKEVVVGSTIKAADFTRTDLTAGILPSIFQKLTAVKNSKFKACFIVDLDPDFNLLESEMYKTTSENVIMALIVFFLFFFGGGSIKTISLPLFLELKQCV